MYSTDERYQHNALVMLLVGRGGKGGDCGGTYQFILMW